MKNWFEHFDEMLRGHDIAQSLGLIGAAEADMQAVLKHVRYQFKSKTKEAVEETFPKTIEKLNKDKWNEVWSQFEKKNSTSTRSLNSFPKIFLDFFQTTDAPHSLKELMKFEWALEIHPWSHRRLSPINIEGMELSENIIIELPELDIQTFQAPVVALYQGHEVLDDREIQQVVIWFPSDGIKFYAADTWEVKILENLQTGLGNALQYAPDDTALVGQFFQWLGRSGLIRSYRLS